VAQPASVSASANVIKIRAIIEKNLERVKGIEPSYSAWKAAALPLLLLYH
jgi:hypothetical protein